MGGHPTKTAAVLRREDAQSAAPVAGAERPTSGFVTCRAKGRMARRYRRAGPSLIYTMPGRFQRLSGLVPVAIFDDMSAGLKGAA